MSVAQSRARLRLREDVNARWFHGSVVDDDHGIFAPKHGIGLPLQHLLRGLSLPGRLAHEMPKLLVVTRRDTRGDRPNRKKTLTKWC